MQTEEHFLTTLTMDVIELNYQLAVQNSSTDEFGCRVPKVGTFGLAGARKGKANTGYPQVVLRQKRHNHNTLTKRKTLRKLGVIYHNNKPRRVCLHVLAFYRSSGQLPENHKFDISHLCHNRLCFNHAHLVREEHEANWKRMGCIGGAECKHEPQCLRGHQM